MKRTALIVALVALLCSCPTTGGVRIGAERWEQEIEHQRWRTTRCHHHCTHEDHR